jgi:hypothetical protein
MYDSRLELLGRVMSGIILSFAPNLILLVLVFVLLVIIIRLAETFLHDNSMCGRFTVQNHLVMVISLLAE